MKHRMRAVYSAIDQSDPAGLPRINAVVGIRIGPRGRLYAGWKDLSASGIHVIEIVNARGVQLTQLFQRPGDSHRRRLQDHQSKTQLTAALLAQNLEAQSLRLF